MTYNVTIIAAKVVQSLTTKPEAFGNADSELRTADGQVFHKSAIIYVSDNGNTLVNTGIAVNFQAEKVLFKEGRYNFVLTDGSKASFMMGRGADIEISEITDADEEEIVEDEEDEAPVAKKRGSKKVAVVEEDEDDEEVSEDDEEVSEDDEEIEVPVRGKKPVVKAKRKVALVEEEDDSDEDDSDDSDEDDEEVSEDDDSDEDDEELEIPVRGKKAAAKPVVKAKRKAIVEEDDSDEEDEDEEDEAPVTKKSKKSVKLDWDNFDE